MLIPYDPFRAHVVATRCPSSGTRSASTQPPRRTDLRWFASIAETSWAVENLINSDPLTLTDRHWA